MVKKTKKATTKKPAKKKAAARKTSSKKAATKKVAKKKAAPKKTVAKKTVPRKTTPKKAAAKKAVPKKAKAKKTVAKKAAPKKAAPKKTVKKKATPKKAVKKKATPKKTVAKKTAPKKTVKKKVPQKKIMPKKNTVKKPSPKKKIAGIPAPAVKPVRPPLQAIKANGASKEKVLSRNFLLELGQAIKEAVEPLARAVRGREVVSTAPSGDATFEIDRIAERALLSFLKSAKAPVAYYSEDAGYSTFSNEQPQNLLIVDPIDGTRAAKSGFEGCVVAIASTRVIERPTIGDVDNACVVELMGNRSFYAERGKGARSYLNGNNKRIKLSDNTDLEALTWSMTVPARPAELIFPTAAPLIDVTSLKGGFFACNSTSFSLTRLITNQLDACVDFAYRYMQDIPDVVRDHFINAGRGNILGIAPYDLAAGLLIAEEAGCKVTNAYGKSFNDVLLLDTSEANFQTIIAASNEELHTNLLHYFNKRIQTYGKLLEARHKRAKR